MCSVILDCKCISIRALFVGILHVCFFKMVCTFTSRLDEVTRPNPSETIKNLDKMYEATVFKDRH